MLMWMFDASKVFDCVHLLRYFVWPFFLRFLFYNNCNVT